MSKFLENVNKRDFDRRISEVVEMLEEKQLYGTISLIKDLKYYLDLATKERHTLVTASTTAIQEIVSLVADVIAKFQKMMIQKTKLHLWKLS